MMLTPSGFVPACSSTGAGELPTPIQRRREDRQGTRVADARRDVPHLTETRHLHLRHTTHAGNGGGAKSTSQGGSEQGDHRDRKELCGELGHSRQGTRAPVRVTVAVSRHGVYVVPLYVTARRNIWDPWWPAECWTRTREPPSFPTSLLCSQSTTPCCGYLFSASHSLIAHSTKRRSTCVRFCI